jgi:hypothetical protein
MDTKIGDDDDGGPPKTYSVMIRVQRTTVEFVHVRVPITDELVTDDHLDGAKAFAAAIEIARTQPQRWLHDAEPEIIVHPLQTPPPEYDH